MKFLSSRTEIRCDQVNCTNRRNTEQSVMGVRMNLMEEWLSDGRNRGWGLKVNASDQNQTNMGGR